VQIGYTPDQERLAAELRAYFRGLMTDDVREALATGEAEGGDEEVYRRLIRRLGSDGWLALSWPPEYGGRGMGAVEQLIFADEAALARIPVPFLTINMVGPMIMRYGTDDQRAFYLPRIAAGELHFAIGYSESDAGTDLAALRTTAVRDGDSYVINGQKMWTSLIQYADCVWLACRTDPSADRHHGLSILVVPTSAEGFSWTPVPTMAGAATGAAYYSDVRVPVSALVGAENTGWSLITNQPTAERVVFTSAAPLLAAVDDVAEWARETGKLDQEWVGLALAEVRARAEALRLLNWKVAASTGPATAVDASAAKVFGTELATWAYRRLMEVLGGPAVLRSGSSGAVLAGRIERQQRAALIPTFRGGTNEVQRDFIASAALRLPVSRR
jgi:3-oxocholest-4-en-26-oyl-CoA dehydrogenase alpha subunit